MVALSCPKQSLAVYRPRRPEKNPAFPGYQKELPPIAYAMPQPDLKVAGCHPHFHLVVADGIFSNEKNLQFHEACLTQDDIVDTQECIQKRVLKYFCKRGFFDKDEMNKMLSYETSGFSLDAKVKIEAFDKDGLERLIRYCARPPFKSENIRVHNSLVNYRFPKPSHDGRLFMTLDPYAESELVSYDVCDLVPGTKDGFPDIEEQVHYDSGPDPPSTKYIDPPHCEYECDPPHWED